MVEKHHLTQILKQVECMLSQQERVPVISKSNVDNILAVSSGTSISQALAADDSMEQQTVVIPEGTSGGELSKFESFLSGSKNHKLSFGYIKRKFICSKPG